MSMFNMPEGMGDLAQNPFMKMMDPAQMQKMFEMPAITSDHHKMIAQTVAAPAVVATAAMSAPAMWFGFLTGMSRSVGGGEVAPAEAQTKKVTKAKPAAKAAAKPAATKAKTAKTAKPATKAVSKAKPSAAVVEKPVVEAKPKAKVAEPPVAQASAPATKPVEKAADTPSAASSPRLADLARSDISISKAKTKGQVDAAPQAKQKPLAKAGSVSQKAADAPKAADDVTASKTPAPAKPELQAKDRPAGLETARDGKADDLKLISGVGPKLESVLNDLGIYHFDQIAAWTAKEVEWVDGYLKFSGRITRDDWIAQAKALAKGGRDEYVKVFGKEPR